MFDLIKKFLIFTLKEIYSFFLKMSLLFLFVVAIIVGIVGFVTSKDKVLTKSNTEYEYVLFNPENIQEDKFENGAFLEKIADKATNISYGEMLQAIDDIEKKDNIKGIIINLDTINISAVKVEEIVKKFEKIKESGKKIYAIGSDINNSNYVLASVADEVISYPTVSASFTLSGYRYTDLYFKGLLDKLGVNMEVVKIGDYKSYGETYTSNTMSNELKEELTRILDKRFNNFVENISKNRNVDKEKLKEDIINGQNFNITPFVARDKNFIDKLEYWGKFLERIGTTEEKIVDIYEYSYNLLEEKTNILVNNEEKDVIAVIYAEGSIQYSGDDENSIMITPNNIGEKIEKVLKIPNLKGIVLRVNSPGGSALASEMIYRSFQDIEVPIYISMSEVAASGGYYISMIGDKVFANKGTITGSIGVVSMFPKVVNSEKYGINSNVITNGKYTETYDSFASLENETKEKIKASMEETYKEFKSRVLENRKISSNSLEEYAQGKIWLGEEALNIKLIDGIASLDETIKILAKDNNITDYEIKNIYNDRDYKNVFKYFKNYVVTKIIGETNLLAFLQNKEQLEKYKFIENNKNLPLYYFPYEIK